MSTVDKMLIKGMRSFDPENKHVITFFKPLTLIVGPNGAGKTTIIECLKLSLTGELPPNSRSGQSFVHDPKVAGETETKAQVKLRFKTVTGKDVVCIRSFQLTQKASRMEFKAIESVLQTINPNTGEKVCLSYRCADMDREITTLMGVSKAVLENVIFVHQDDSNWPLQDPSTLKKKFDDIFSATRYTKALEVIKKLHKDQAQEIKTYKLKLENLQTLKDAAFKLRESVSQDLEKSNFLKTQMKELEENIQNVENKILQVTSTKEELRKLQERILAKTTERSTLFKLQQTQYAALSEENEDTDEELREWQTRFEEKTALLATKISKLERKLTDSEAQSSVLSDSINSSVKEIGKLEAEAEDHLSLQRERDLSIQSLFKKHNLGHYPNPPFSNDVASALLNRIKSRLLDLERNLQDKKKSNEVELNTVWDAYVTISESCSTIEAQRHAKLETKDWIAKRISNKESDLEFAERELSNLNLTNIDEKEKNLLVELERKTHQLEERNFESNIHDKQTEIFALELKIKDLDREKDIMSRSSEERVKLGLKKSELETCRGKYKKIMDENRDRIRNALKGRFPSEKDLKKDINYEFGSLKKEYDGLSYKSLEAEKEVKLVQSKLQDATENLSKLRRDMDAKRRFIQSKLELLVQMPSDIDSYPKVLQEATEEKDVQKSKYSIADGMRQMFDPFERVARAHHMCPCCERAFSPEEEDDFVKKQRVKSARSAEHMKLLAVENSNADSRFQQLDKLRMAYDEFIKLGREMVPIAEKKLEALTDELNQKSQGLDDLIALVAQAKAEKDAMEALAQQVEIIDKLYHEMQNLQGQVDGLERDLDVHGQGVRTIEEIQSELNALRNKKEQLNNEVESIRTEQKYINSDLSNIQMRYHSAREEKLKALSIIDKVDKAEKELVSLKEQMIQADFDEKNLAEALVPLSNKKEKTQKDHADSKLKLEQEFVDQEQVKKAYEKEVENIFSLVLKIKEYMDLKKGERLKDLQEKHLLWKSQLLQCETTRTGILSDLEKSKDLLRNQDHIKRNIDDNLNYRKTKAKVSELASEIEALENQILSIGGASAVDAEYKRALQEKERLNSELKKYEGTQSVYDTNVAKYKAELKQAQYTDIDKRYFNQLIQLKTAEMANKDLDRYYNALDKALMRFHSMKMEEINKIIRELWQQTYRGQDIDYISIQSDSEGSGTRSYSYRVVMQTGNAELEMRGRCSAGQKVLASLIIRLALAETFCLNCGILALDEPTTNLDAPNAESLAAALLRIMEDRKDQTNFQLIVITHDERFAQMIGQRQHAEKYYRITKDEHQHSIIESQEIFE